MALIDLDKIIITRTVTGIRCPVCGGNLILSQKRSVTSRFVLTVSFRTLHPKDYECEICQKKYILL